jgi:phage tail-like protein
MSTPIVKPKFLATKWNYRASFQGLGISYFESMTAIKGKVEMTPFHVGGEMDVALWVPGKRMWDAVTLTAGVSENDELYKWWQQVGDLQGKGLEIDQLERKLTVELFKRDKTSVLRTYELIGCVPEENSMLDGLDSKELGGYAVEAITVKIRSVQRL